jgi:LuxR family transcriptional regulator, glucitol operon activator
LHLNNIGGFMAFSVSRLTLYAVLSAIEEDLRKAIQHNLSHIDANQLLGEEVLKKAIKRVEIDLELDDKLASHELLLSYIDFADAYKTLNTHSKSLPANIAKYLKEITPNLEKLAPIRNRVAHSRPLNFDDLSVALDTAAELINNNVFDWNELKTTLLRLNQEPSFVLGLEIPRYYTENSKQNHNLPIPDFDETGFLGRQQQVKDLIKLALGPYPVISIIGQGNVGKTALALKVAYDILDLPDCPFDAVVWTTSKTMQLTSQEIIKIEGAISDSLGMLRNVADTLSGNLKGNEVDEILEYLAQFRILLILDNLETVLDDRIRDFLGRLPNGSKILITSRIGLGAFEHPIQLSPLNESEAIQLLRALANIRGLRRLADTSASHLKKYCTKMKNSPGFIKWFVSVVQAGVRPEEVLDKNELFLDFCMSNIYHYLSEDSRKVLNVMLCIPSELSQAELAFLTEMEVIDLQRALQQLLTTPMVLMSSRATGSSFASEYIIADLPREYLSKRHPTHPHDYATITKRRRQLIAAEERAKAEQRNRPYSPYSILVRSKSDFIVARYLQSALNRGHEERFNEADKELNKARSLAPEYFEVRRVEAWIKVKQRNFPAAQLAYEAAVELEPQHAPLLYWYADFLMRYLNDTEAALRLFENAAKLDPNSPVVQLGIARAQLYLMDYEQAQQTLQKLLQSKDLPDIEHRKAYDLYLQSFQRQAETTFFQRKYWDTLNALEKLKTSFETCPRRLVDEQMKEKLRKGQLIADDLLGLQDANLHSQAVSISSWIADELEGKHIDSAQQSYPAKGVITGLPLGKFYGFLRSENGVECFFHRTDLYDTSNWQFLKVGDQVHFLITYMDERKPRAISIRLEKDIFQNT